MLHPPREKANGRVQRMGLKYSYGESTGPGATGTAARMQEQVSQTVTDVKEKVTDFGRQAADEDRQFACIRCGCFRPDSIFAALGR